jgi:hypothetical protein
MDNLHRYFMDNLHGYVKFNIIVRPIVFIIVMTILIHHNNSKNGHYCAHIIN